MSESKRWTLAEIKQANNDAGYCFFDRKTMKFFGDTMRSFSVAYIDGKVFVKRVKPMMADGCNMSGVGKLYEFNPETGNVG